jgi:hypothetical protein
MTSRALESQVENPFETALQKALAMFAAVY